jgi:hypothetical protein
MLSARKAYLNMSIEQSLLCINGYKKRTTFLLFFMTEATTNAFRKESLP